METREMDASLRQELTGLLSALVDDCLDAAGEERLGSLLAANAEARELYRDYLTMHADLALRDRAVELPAAALPASPVLASPVRNQSRLARWAVFAVLLLAASGILGWWLGSAQTDLRPVAQVASVVDAQWTADSAPIAEGAWLTPGVLDLQAGQARLVMNCGAELRLMGPVRLELLDSKAVRLQAGQLAVLAPDSAVGFRVLTPTADVVDLGTEFGMSVEADGSTEVHVLQGVVVARPTSSDGVIPILAREAGRFDAMTGGLVAIAWDATPFLSAALATPVPEAVEEPTIPRIADGARIIFLGDRTTDHETHLLMINQALSDLPAEIAPKLWNAGIALPLYFEEDDFERYVLRFRPTHAVLEFGSDISLSRTPRTQKQFESGVTRLVDRLQAENIEPILQTAFPVEHAKPEAQELLDGYNRFLRSLAAERNLRLAEVDKHFRKAPGGPERLVSPNGYGPTFAGHREMADVLLDTLGFTDRQADPSLQLSLLPGVITQWHVRTVPEDQSEPGDITNFDPQDGWKPLAIPQPEAFSERLPDPSHSVSWRDRTRGFATHLPYKKGQRYEAVTHITSDERKTVTINVGAAVQGVWLNGKKIHEGKPWHGWHAGRDRFEATLEAGENTLVIASGNSFFVSITDTLDWALPRPGE